MFGIDDAIIGGGLSLIGSLFGGGEEEQASYVDYSDMVRRAERAGLNPLTAIRNGGSAGFTHTTTPGLSSGDTIAKVLGGIGKMITDYDPMADERKELEFKLQEAQLQSLQMDNALRRKASIGGVPVRTGRTNDPVKAGALTSLGPQEPTIEAPTVTNPHETAVIDPRVRDADAFEQRYGDSEVAQMVYGGLVGLRDFRANYDSSWLAAHQRWKPRWAEVRKQKASAADARSKRLKSGYRTPYNPYKSVFQ
ncbi:MAG: hypothetical protein WBA15_12455 [Mesorhizobium sp.]